MYQMKGLVRRKQMIHLHCFNGSKDLIWHWREVFPNTYFGFTTLVKSFRPDQLKALRTLEIDRILLETDAPYFTPPGMDVSTPACNSYTAKAVAVAGQEDCWVGLAGQQQPSSRCKGEGEKASENCLPGMTHVLRASDPPLSFLSIFFFWDWPRDTAVRPTFGLSCLSKLSS